jgi:hypothetical protein
VYFPQARESLLNISGVGKVKYERYGKAFLAIIKEYCRGNELDEKYKTPMRKTDKDANRRYVAVGEAYNAGESIDNLMKRYDCERGYDIESSGAFHHDRQPAAHRRGFDRTLKTFT